jgi:tRNA-2-methylthio-N6-dimethylallyladenosine synthase
MYSPRSGTRAAVLTDQVELGIKKDRLLRLNNLQYGIAAEINQSLEGSVQEVLVEGPSKTNKDMMTGRTRSNRIIIFSAPHNLIGKLINVKILEGKTFSLQAEAVI